MSERVAAGRVATDAVRAWMRDVPSRPFVVGLGGSVAVGKSTLAASVAECFGEFNHEALVIGTDGFLFPNATLIERQAIDRKGEPDTYDEASLRALIAAMRAGASTLSVPTYSHRTFDVGSARTVSVGDVVMFEGVNALQPTLVDSYDLSIYLHADETVVRAWYVERFLGLINEAERDEESYYRRFVEQSPDTRRETAGWVWDTINAPNLHRFVLPTRSLANVVLHLDADHCVIDVEHSKRVRPGRS
jgi:type I pantothenate kinase